MLKTTSRYRSIVTTADGNVRLDLAVGDVIDDLEVEAIIAADVPSCFESVAPKDERATRQAAISADAYYRDVVRTYPIKDSHPDQSDREFGTGPITADDYRAIR